MKKLILLLMCACVASISYGQRFSASGQLGYMIPGGNGVGETAGIYDVDGGIVYDIDILYHLNEDEPKFGVGLNYASAILASVDTNIDAYGYRMIGAKAHYSVKVGGFSPYGGLTLGAATLTNGAGESSTGLGIGLEGGLAFGGFLISADYYVPTKFTIDSATFGVMSEGSVGGLVISLGYRYRLSL